MTTFACDGCREAPWPDCAACGAPTALALADPDFPHALTLCVACYAVVLASRVTAGAAKAPGDSYEAQRSRRRRTQDPQRRAWDRQRQQKRTAAQRELVPA